jgi:2-iminobutanoate/2-iminopropanoate deaminase
MSIKKIYTKNAPTPIGPYNQAIIAGKFMFLSGQIGINPRTGKLVKGDIKKQTIQAIKNMKEILKSIGLKLNDVVKTEVFITDIRKMKAFNEAYSKMFNNNTLPARATVEVNRLPMGAKVEIVSMAYVGDQNV